MKDNKGNIQIGFLGFLTILFVGLKLTGYIAWSWFWVLFPVIIIPIIVVGFFLFLFIAALITKVLK